MIVAGRVLRRVVANKVDLKTGGLTLDNYTVGLAVADDTMVFRDGNGGFHEFYGSTVIESLVESFSYAREPVATYANLPAGDPNGSIRLVTGENIFYGKKNGVWSAFGAGSVSVPLILETDGVGTDLAFKVSAAGSGSKYLSIDVATQTPKLNVIDGNYSIGIEPQLIRIRDVTNWVDTISTGITVHSALHNLVISSSDVTVDGVSISGNTAVTTHVALADPHTQYVLKTARGAINGVAPLESDGKILSIYLPSYVDDVLEYTNLAGFPVTGETGKIYLAMDTNKMYRWSGSVYAEVSSSLALGTTSATAFRGDYGNTAYTHSQATGNPHGTTIANISGLQTALDAKALDSDVVHVSGTEDITGRKTFTEGYTVFKDTTGNSTTIAFAPHSDVTNSYKNSIQWDNFGATSTVMFIGRRDGITGNGEEDLRLTQFHSVLAVTNGKVVIGDQTNAININSAGQLAIGALNTLYCGVWHGSIAPVNRDLTNPSIFLSSEDTFINSGLVTGYVQIRNGNQKNVMYHNDPAVLTSAYGSTTGAIMGGHQGTAWAVWNGGTIPTNDNYGLYLSGNGQSAEINATVYSYLSCNAAGRVRASSTDIRITPTATSLEGVRIQKYTGGSACAIYNNSLTPSNINYGLLFSAAHTEVNGTTSSRLNVNNVSIATAKAVGLYVTDFIASDDSHGFSVDLTAVNFSKDISAPNLFTSGVVEATAGIELPMNGYTTTAWTARANGYPMTPTQGSFTHHGFAVPASTGWTASISHAGMTQGQTAVLSIKITGTASNATLAVTYTSFTGDGKSLNLSSSGKSVDLIVIRTGNGLRIVGNLYT